jgi:minimal PKS chain-length factor (CLF/KS beta)
VTRAVVTGLGVVSPNGIGVDAYWAATLAGKSGIARISAFDTARYPTTLGGSINGFDVGEHVPKRLMNQTDRWTQLGLAAAALALADAGLGPQDVRGFDAGVITASSSGGNEFGQSEIQQLWAAGPDHVSAYQSIAWFYAATTGQLSIRHATKGRCGVLVAEQASGLDALGEARQALREDMRIVLSGGTEAPLSPYALTCQIASGRLSTETVAGLAYRPFDASARGHVPGEGGAILVLQRDHEHGYGSIAGYAATFDPPPGSRRPPALRRAIDLAIADAGLRPADISLVFADAAGVPELDLAEARALAAVFGPLGVPVTAPKSMTGRLYAGGAPLDVAAALLAIRDGVAPPTISTQEVPDHYEIDLVLGGPRDLPVRHVLVLARGAGGFNSAVVVSANRRGHGT